MQRFHCLMAAGGDRDGGRDLRITALIWMDMTGDAVKNKSAAGEDGVHGSWFRCVCGGVLLTNRPHSVCFTDIHIFCTLSAPDYPAPSSPIIAG